MLSPLKRDFVKRTSDAARVLSADEGVLLEGGGLLQTQYLRLRPLPYTGVDILVRCCEHPPWTSILYHNPAKSCDLRHPVKFCQVICVLGFIGALIFLAAGETTTVQVPVVIVFEYTSLDRKSVV